jgi:hypothetical protein
MSQFQQSVIGVAEALEPAYGSPYRSSRVRSTE